MKELGELNLPDDLRYAEDHEWVRLAGDKVVVGVSDYAQDRLGDITYVEIPQVGDAFKKGESCGTLESVKAVADLFIPLSGEILAVNDALAESPGLVNEDPYGEGWILEVKPLNAAELDELMDSDAYLLMLERLE